MPFIGIHLIAALFFAIHAVRTGRELYWLIILFAFPVLGSLVYLFAIYLPESRAPRMMKAGVRKLTPGRELREARQAYDMTPTVQNRMRLAAALLDNGEVSEALELYENCLQGPFAQDRAVMLAIARARLLAGKAEAAVALLQDIRRLHADFAPADVSLLLALAWSRLGQQEAARAEFEYGMRTHASVAMRTEYGLWALERGDVNLAHEMLDELERSRRHWSGHARHLHKADLDRLKTALRAAR